MKPYAEIEQNAQEIITILPYVGTKVLMQLRDHKPGIIFPGQWGFFSGSIEKGETPEESAKRELLEELNYKPKVLNKLCADIYPNNIIIHFYFFPLTSQNKIILKEGADFALVSLEEVLSKKIYSKKMNRYYPIAKWHFVAEIMKRLLNKIKSN